MAFRGISYNNLPVEIIIIKCPETHLNNKVKWHKNKKKEIVKIKKHLVRFKYIRKPSYTYLL